MNKSGRTFNSVDFHDEQKDENNPENLAAAKASKNELKKENSKLFAQCRKI